MSKSDIRNVGTVGHPDHGKSETPLTDEAEQAYHSWNQYAEKYKHIPEALDQATEYADPFFVARKLEKQLAAKEAELAEVKRVNDLLEQQVGEARRNEYEAQAAEEQPRAQVARLLLRAREFHDSMHDEYISGCFMRNGIGTDCGFKILLASLPEQSARDAAVLRAADILHNQHLTLDFSDRRNKCGCVVCQAVRGEKK